mgnify:CR=1 FL=1
MILYLTSQQHTNLLDFLTEQTDALPIKKMTGNFMLKQFVIYEEFLTLYGISIGSGRIWG